MSKITLIIILSCIVSSTCDAKDALSHQPIQLDNRDKFNSTSIYTEVAGKEFVIFESISDFSFKSIALSIADISLLADGSSNSSIVNNGESWGKEHIASASVFEIHDAFPYHRKDGGIDLYYSHGLNRTKNQLSLWRRCSK